MRALMLAVVCLAVGFGAGWGVFETPWQSGPQKPTGLNARSIQIAVIKQSGGRYATAVCRQRQYPTSKWDCRMTIEGGRFLQAQTVTVGRYGRLAFTEPSTVF
jgi:hypothetical protein